MMTITLRTEISPEGRLTIDVPCALPAGPVEVVVVAQPVPQEAKPPFDTLRGIWSGLMPDDLDVDAELAEMNREWIEGIERSLQ